MNTLPRPLIQLLAMQGLTLDAKINYRPILRKLLKQLKVR